MFYTLFILISMTLIGVVNALVNKYFFNFAIWQIVVFVIITTVAVILIDGFIATIIRRLLPNKWFDKDKKGFIASKKECRFYEKLGIKNWKDKILELGCFTSFRKNKLAKPNDNEYVARFILECNYGFVIHLFCVILGFTVIFIFPLKYALCFGVPVGAVNAFLNLLPALVLRYNVPKLQQLYRLNARLEKRNNENVSAKDLDDNKEIAK